MRTQAPAPSPMPAPERSRHPTTKVIRRFTRHSVMSPVSLVTALISFTHTPLMPFTVSDVFFRPWRTASSTLFSEDALTSLTLAPVIALLQWGRPPGRTGQARPGQTRGLAGGGRGGP